MKLADENLNELMCKALCAQVSLHHRPDGRIQVDTPFAFPDGDHYSIYLERLPSGGFRLSDMGSTLMHLSYEQDIDKLSEGTRAKVFAQILSELDIANDDGNLYIEFPPTQLADGMFRFGQALTRVHDLSFLNRIQVESTFYDDLQQRLTHIVGIKHLIRDYAAPGVPSAENYLADFAINYTDRPVLIFGVPSGTKARLATIVMQYLRSHHFRFRGLVVYSDMAALPRADVARLTTAANDQIPSLGEPEALEYKINEALAG